MIIINILFLFFSLFFLVKSSDYVVEYSERLGKIFNIPEFIIGLIVISVGTSLPELVTAITSALLNKTEFIIGNVVGANISNIFLNLGLSVLLVRSIKINPKVIEKDIRIMIVSTIAFFFVIIRGKIYFLNGLLLIFVYFFYLYRTYKNQKKLKSVIDKDVKNTSKKDMLKILFVLIFSFVVLAYSARYTIIVSQWIADDLSLSDLSIVSLTFVAIGTSLPELIVSIKSLRKRKYDMIIGNIIGSNLFNMLMVSTIPALISPIIVSNTIHVAIPFFLSANLILYLAYKDENISKKMGIIYLVGFFSFIITLFFFA